MTDYREAPPEGEDSVATKPALWRPLSRAVGGFDVDPAAGCEPEQIATVRYTESDDGLTKPWFGTVWLNPPFSEKTRWYRRLVGQYRCGDVERAVAVAPVDTSTDWFQEWFRTADEIAFLNGRDWYITNNGRSPSLGTMVGAWNPNQELIDALGALGVVAQVRNDTAQQELPA